MLKTGNRSCQHRAHAQVSQVGYGPAGFAFPASWAPCDPQYVTDQSHTALKPLNGGDPF
jgi:hypothetical protein